jgi:bifunctional polynucleotide phosphatase/kinase
MNKPIWNIQPFYAEYTSSNFEYKSKIAFFDLDGTIIKASRKQTSDFNWLYDNVPESLLKLYLDNYCIIIITNQKNLQIDNKKINVWCDKISKIFDEIIEHSKNNFNFKLFVALSDSKYRKPMTGFIELIDHPIDHKNSFFCGDACGRKNDFADTDLKFAINCNINFKTPEHFFINRDMKYPSIKYPILSNSNTSFEFKPMDKVKEIIVMVGYPGSGKSTITQYINNNYDYTIINQDTCKTKKKCIKECINAIKNNKSIIIDNTNPDIKSRQEYINMAKTHNYNVRAIYMTTN